MAGSRLAEGFGGQAKPKLVIQEAPQLPAPRRVLQIAPRLRLDLADALAGHGELLTWPGTPAWPSVAMFVTSWPSGPITGPDDAPVTSARPADDMDVILAPCMLTECHRR